MNRDYREEYISGMHKNIDNYTDINNLKREYSLYEIAAVSRSGPAKSLGLKNKGHLAPGADADIAVYESLENRDIAEVFAHPAMVFKDGQLVVEDGELKSDRLLPGRTLMTKPEYDKNIKAEIRDDFQKFYSMSIDNYAVTDNYFNNVEVVPCRSKE
jgi:formylmethanofuran dehydrogenase subunit A